MLAIFAALIISASFASTDESYRIVIERTKNGKDMSSAELIIRSGSRAEFSKEEASQTSYMDVSLNPTDIEIPEGVIVELSEGVITSGEKKQVFTGSHLVLPGEPTVLSERDERTGDTSVLTIKAEQI